MTCKAVEEYGKQQAQESARITRIETLYNNVKSLMDSLKLTAEQAMLALNIPQEEQPLIKGMLNL